MSVRASINSTLRVYRTRVDVISGVRKPPVNDGLYPTFKRFQSVSGNDLSNYAQRVRNGEFLPSTNYVFSKEDVVYPQGNNHCIITWIPTGDTSTYSGPLNPVGGPGGFGVASYLEPSSSQLANHKAYLDNKMLDKLKNQKVNIAQVFAERKQTASTISSTFRDLVRSINAVKRGNFSLASRILRISRPLGLNTRKGIANNWLRLQYGWLPLLNDVYGSAEKLAEIGVRTIERKPIMSVGAKMGREVQASGDTYPGSWPVGYYFLNGKWDYKSRLYYTVSDSVLHDLTSIGLTNPFTIAWELLPWSFVVDWAFPIGNWINRQDATVGLQFLSGHYVYFYKGKISASVIGTHVSGNYHYNWRAMPGHTNYVNYQRTAMNTFPSVPSVRIKDPGSLLHAANAWALLTQVFKE